MRRLLLAAFPASQTALLVPAATDDATIASDESWGDFHPINSGDEHGHGTVPYQSFVQSLAEQVMRRSGNITDDTKGLLLSIDEAITIEEGKADGYHDAQQRQLNRAAAELRQCNVWFNTYNVTQVAGAWRAQAEARQNHSTCRGEEELAYNATVEAWASVKQVSDNFALTAEPSLEEPSPSLPIPHGETDPPGINQGSCASFDNWLSSSKATIELAEGNLAIAKATYNSSYETYKAKHEECDADLVQLDSATCHLGDVTCIHCSSYDTCYLTRNATYWAEEGVARSSEAERKDEHVTMQYVKCLIRVLLRPLPNSTAIQGCLDESHDTTHLDISYPGVDAKLDCTSLASEEKPCDTQYETQEYGLWSSHSYMCTPCAPNCTEVTDFGTVATTSAPTTPAPTTPAPPAVEMVGVCPGYCNNCPARQFPDDGYPTYVNWMMCYHQGGPFGNAELNALMEWFQNNATEEWTAFDMTGEEIRLYTSEEMADDFSCPSISLGPGDTRETIEIGRESHPGPSDVSPPLTFMNWTAMGPPPAVYGGGNRWMDRTEWGTEQRFRVVQCWAKQQ